MATALTEEQQAQFRAFYEDFAKYVTAYFEDLKIAIARCQPFFDAYYGVHRQNVSQIHTQYRRKKRGRW